MAKTERERVREREREREKRRRRRKNKETKQNTLDLPNGPITSLKINLHGRGRNLASCGYHMALHSGSSSFYHLVGLVIKAFTLGAEGPKFDSHLHCGDFLGGVIPVT